MKKEQDFHESDLFRVRVKTDGQEKTVGFTVKSEDNAARKFKEAMASADETLAVEWTHRLQTGFDQPLLAGMFLDKPVLERNAVQTISRLNRCHPQYSDTGGIFDIMAVTVIQTHLSVAA